MSRVIDKENIVNSLQAAPDKLRAVIGSYTKSDLNPITFPSDKINTNYISKN